ncbi:MAG: hypothetical protein ACREOO_13985 [bacterium]
MCWFTYRRVRDSAAGMHFAYLAAFGVGNFFGNIMSASFVGDFSNAAVVLHLPMSARHLASLLGALSVGAILFVTGRELRRWTPLHVNRVAGAVGVGALPAPAGMALVVLINQPMPMPASFLIARAGEASFWVFAAVGILVTRNYPTAGGTDLRLRWMDGVVAIFVVLAVRLLVQGISLTP